MLHNFDVTYVSFGDFVILHFQAKGINLFLSKISLLLSLLNLVIKNPFEKTSQILSQKIFWFLWFL